MDTSALTNFTYAELYAEIIKREREAKKKLPKIESFADSVTLFSNITKKKKEELWVATLDGQKRLIKKHKIAQGTVNTVHIWPRLIFEKVIQDKAPYLVVAHNHPSGDVEITEQDKNVTNVIERIGHDLNAQMLDHLIISQEGCRSIKYGDKFPD